MPKGLVSERDLSSGPGDLRRCPTGSSQGTINPVPVARRPLIQAMTAGDPHEVLALYGRFELRAGLSEQAAADIS